MLWKIKITAGMFFSLFSLLCGWLPTQIVYYTLQEAQYGCVTHCKKKASSKDHLKCKSHKPANSASAPHPDCPSSKRILILLEIVVYTTNALQSQCYPKILSAAGVQNELQCDQKKQKLYGRLCQLDGIMA